jgi:hypothetical protein
MSTIDKIKAKVENVIHKDHSNTTTGSTTGTTHTTGGVHSGVPEGTAGLVFSASFLPWVNSPGVGR